MLKKNIENVIMFTIVIGFVASLNAIVFLIETFVPKMDAPVFAIIISLLVLILYKLDRSMFKDENS